MQRGWRYPFGGDTGNAGCHGFLASSLFKYGPRVTCSLGKTPQSSLTTNAGGDNLTMTLGTGLSSFQKKTSRNDATAQLNWPFVAALRRCVKPCFTVLGAMLERSAAGFVTQLLTFCAKSQYPSWHKTFRTGLQIPFGSATPRIAPSCSYLQVHYEL